MQERVEALSVRHERPEAKVSALSQPNDPEPNLVVTIDGIDIKPTQQLPILGLLLQQDGKAAAAIAKVNTAFEQVT